MKTYILSSIIFFLLAVEAFSATDDPVKDYLTNRQNAYQRGDDTFYADDKVLELELDLMGNGQIERLISSSLDRNGKAGNTWTVFVKEGDGWKRIGVMTFHGSGFYLGKIDQLNGQYGIVTFFSSGNQEGSLMADVFNGSSIQETKIGQITRDLTTRQLIGTALMQRYFGGQTPAGHPAVKTITVNELTKTYGIKADQRNFADAMREKHDDAVNGH